MKVGVIGGSLGGLIAGCLLADDGHDVTIYERSPAHLEERGAGIGFLPMTARYLTERAGLDVTTIAVVTSHIRCLARDGSVVDDTQHRYLLSSWNTVYREMLRSFDDSRYLLGHELVSLEPENGTIRFANGHEDRPDLVVCADGVGSTARHILIPGLQPQYSGYVAWRGVVEETVLSPATVDALGDALTYVVTANSHLLVYPIPGRDGSVAEGERLINVVWYRNYLPGGELDDLLTDRRGERREVSVPPGMVREEHAAEVRAHAAARLPGVVAEVIEAIPQLFIQVVLDLAVERMAFGRVCLLGDSAFVVRPHAAAGTAKAAADAWTLRDAIAAHPDSVHDALAAWEPGQLALGRSLLERTRAIGRRSQVDNSWVAGDPDLIFGLYAPGD